MKGSHKIRRYISVENAHTHTDTHTNTQTNTTIQLYTLYRAAIIVDTYAYSSAPNPALLTVKLDDKY